jgi:hypothetical protein
MGSPTPENHAFQSGRGLAGNHPLCRGLDGVAEGGEVSDEAHRPVALGAAAEVVGAEVLVEEKRGAIASVKVVEFAWVGEAAIGGQAALGGSRVGASSVGGISISAMASTCM